MSKQIEVKINGIQYFPGNTSSTTDKPFDEPSVNYRALVNDKLEEFGTFSEDAAYLDGNPIPDILSFGHENFNPLFFIIAGRIQSILYNIACYGNGSDYGLYLGLVEDNTWEGVYDLLINEANEEFVKTGVWS